MSNQLSGLLFLLSDEQACSYLPEISQSACLDPRQKVDAELLGALTRRGFRRSGQLVYRPHCPSCSACIPVRIPVQQFSPGRGQKRTFKRGQQLQVIEQSPALTDEYYRLYQSYISARHADGSMYPPSPQQFRDFLGQSLPFSRFFEFRLNNRLLAVAVSDVLPDGLSAVYSFYDPRDRYFSLGRQTILWQIEHARQQGLPYLYLGYWIRDCQKMNYKTEYQPLELYINGRWQQ
jgi:arginyl-tRNA--protein-N-Asp/Glu arginylyltransferase